MDTNAVPIKVVKCDAARREPGSIFFTTRPGGLPTRAAQAWIIGIDEFGQTVLNREFSGTSQDIRYQPDGTLLFSQSAQGLINELDLNGNILKRWHARGKYLDKQPPEGSIELPVDFIHHTVNFMPNGNFLLLDAESRLFEDWHGSATIEGAPRCTAEVVGDKICEVTRDGVMVRGFPVLDILDPYRPTHSIRSDYWRKQGFPNGFDWCHCNAVSYDESDDTIIFSLRHQDCIVKIRRLDGGLVWILGNHSHWQEPWSRYLLNPEGPLQWQYHQHDCSVVAPNRVLCFDNGNYRSGAFEPKLSDEENYSRAVEFEIDQVNGSVRQVWSWGGPPQDKTYACYQGGALRLPMTGNTFCTFGGICLDQGKPTSENIGTFGCSRFVEVTPEGEVVFDMWIDDSASQTPRSFSAFRATHAPKL